MKKLILPVLILVIFFSAFCVNVFAKEDISDKICLSSFVFKNADSEEISEINPGEAVYAEEILQKTEKGEYGISAAFSIIKSRSLPETDFSLLRRYSS